MADTRKVVVELETTPKGELVEVLYLGMFENGATHDLTEEQVQSFEAVSGIKFPSSGYLFAGAPRSAKQQEAFDQNVKEGFSGASPGFEPSQQNPTQLPAVQFGPGDAVEGQETTDTEGSEV